MAGRAPRMKDVRVHAHVGVGGGGGAVGVEVQVRDPDAVSAEAPGRRNMAAGPRGRQSPSVVVYGSRRSTGGRRLREKVVGEAAVAAHGGSGLAAGTAAARPRGQRAARGDGGAGPRRPWRRRDPRCGRPARWVGGADPRR